MTTPQQGSTPEIQTSVGFETIDADGHVLEAPDWWRGYLPEEYVDWAPVPASAEPDGSVRAEGHVYRLPVPYPPGSAESGILATPGGWKLDLEISLSPDEVSKRGGAAPEDRLEAMDRDDVAIAYLYPSAMLSLPWVLRSAAFALALTRAYNDWLITFCSTDPYRLRGAAILPVQDLILAVREMERVREAGIRAIMLRPNPVADQNLDHPNFERVWDAAEDLDLAIGIHEGFGLQMATLGVERCETWLQAHALEHPAEHMAASMLLITGGVLQRHPQLRVAFLENGAGWVPFWLHHLDEHYEKWHKRYPRLDAMPSEYFKRQCFVGVEPDYALIPHLIDFGYEETLVFSTDFPHFDAIYPGSVSALADRNDLSERSKRRLLRDNALRLYAAT